jgi:integrase
MARSTDRLNTKVIEAWIKRAVAGTAEKGKLSDGRGLYLMLTKAKTPVWRLHYRLGAKDSAYAVGIYPEVSLEQARIERERVREQVKHGRDPVKARQLARAANAAASDTTFRGVAEEWLALRQQRWSPIHYKKTKEALERDVLPYLGALPVDEITPDLVAAVIKKIVQRGANETASKVLWNVRQVFDLAQTRPGAVQRANPSDPAHTVLQDTKPYTPRPALLRFDELGAVLRQAQVAPLSPAVRMAHRLVAFTAARIGNAVAARWEQFDLDGPTPCWTTPREEMKKRDDRQHDHKVFLGATIARELGVWKSVTGGKGHLFPPLRGSKPHITREALEKAYRSTLKLAKRHSVHGWRASFATLAKDAGKSRDVVELALDHIHDSEVVRAYDRSERLAQRVELMRWWDGELSGAEHAAPAGSR